MKRKLFFCFITFFVLNTLSYGSPLLKLITNERKAWFHFAQKLITEQGTKRKLDKRTLGLISSWSSRIGHHMNYAEATIKGNSSSKKIIHAVGDLYEGKKNAEMLQILEQHIGQARRVVQGLSGISF